MTTMAKVVAICAAVIVGVTAWVKVEEMKQATVQAGFVACAVACARSAPVEGGQSLPGAMR